MKTTTKTTVKNSTVNATIKNSMATSKNEVSIVTEENFINSVIKGGKQKNIKEELKNYLTTQFNALYITSNIATFQLKVSDVIKQFLVISDNKINASSYDLNALIQECIFELASDYKKNGEKRIPCIKANSNNVSILMTCDVSKFDFFYEKNIKSLATIEKSKKAREEKKIKEEEEKKAREEEEKKKEENTVYIDNADKATLAIMELLVKYGNKLDLESIKNGIATIESKSKKSEKKNIKVA